MVDYNEIELGKAKDKLNKTRENMKKNHPAPKDPKSFQPGDLVVLLKDFPESRTVPVKSQTQTWGVYRVVGPDPKNPTGVDLIIANPWIGQESELAVHQERLRGWNGTLNPNRRQYLDPKDDIDLKKLNVKGVRSLAMTAQFLKKAPEEVSHLDLIGCKVDVYYSRPAYLKGWWEGVIKDYEPKLGKHWIQYKVSSKDGHNHEPQDIISNRAGENVRLFKGRRIARPNNRQ